MNDTIFLTKASLPPYEEYIQEIQSLWESHWITTFGPKHDRLAQELTAFLGCRETALFANGHSALEAAVQALDDKGEIITTPYTFASTTNAIVRMGCTPVFCDIDPETCCMDPDKIESLITDRTVAILPVHVYGNICNVDRISHIADQYKLKVIYDAAHAFGVTYQGKKIASFGDASVFSFHASKVFNTAEGGAVCYHDQEFGRRLKLIRNFGLEKGDGLYPAGNGKMSELSAALGLCNLRHFREEIEKRERLFLRYQDCLFGMDEILLPAQQEHVRPNYAYMPVRFTEGKVRDRVYEYLQKHRVLCQKHFDPPTSSFSCYKERYPADVPVADALSRRILLLPLYADLTDKQVRYICKLVQDSMM